MLKVRTHSSAKLDDKGRLSLPSRLREALNVNRVHSLVLLSVQGGIWGWTPEDFDRIEEQWSEFDPFWKDCRDFTQGVLATADEVEIDRSGRIRVPAEHRMAAGIERDVRLFSVLNRIEIWDETRWLDRFQEAAASRAAMEGLRGVRPPPASASSEGEPS